MAWAFACIFVGVRVAERRGTAWGWIAGVVVAIASLMVLFGPVTDAIQHRQCEIEYDFENCD